MCIPRDEWQITASPPGQDTINPCSSVHKPEEWVAFKCGEDAIFARIFCPILTHNPPEDYIVWTSDKEMREMRSSMLYRVMVMAPRGDEDVDGVGMLPLLATPTTHLPSHSNQIVHVSPSTSPHTSLLWLLSCDNHSSPISCPMIIIPHLISCHMTIIPHPSPVT